MSPDADEGEGDPVESHPWDRQPDEPSHSYAVFRIFRDRPPSRRRLEEVAESEGLNYRTLRRWAQDWNWRDRADAWDDAAHRIEDAERLDALREMHSLHRTAGRSAMKAAMTALDTMDSDVLAASPQAIARLMELGAKLERSTLIVSVEELQGLDTEPDTEDPWDRIARELDPHVPAPQ